MQTLSSEYECLELRGASACGTFGSCTQLSGGANNVWRNEMRLLLAQAAANETCLCQEGWVQTAEVSLYFLSPDEFEAGLGLCNINKGLLGTFYGLMFAISFFSLVMQCTQLSRWKQVRRLMPLFVTLILTIFTSLYRLARFDHALIGKDTFFTVLIANLAYLPVAVTVIFTEKYLKVLTLKVLLFGAKTLKTFKLFRRFNRFALILDFGLYQLFWLSLFVGDQRKLGQIVFRVSLFALGIRAFTLFVIVRVTLTRFVGDMQHILENFLQSDELNLAARPHAASIASSPVMSTPDSQPAKKNDSNSKDASTNLPKKFVSLKTQIRDKLIPETKQYRLFLEISTLAIFFGYVFSALWPLLTYNISYITPLYHASWQVVHVAAVLNYRRRVKKRLATGGSSFYNSTPVRSKLLTESKSKSSAALPLEKPDNVSL